MTRSLLDAKNRDLNRFTGIHRLFDFGSSKRSPGMVNLTTTYIE